MPESSSSKTHLSIRLQGTDGIRREVIAASHPSVRGLSPQQVFLEKGFITEEFMELYAYAHVASLMQRREVRRGDDFVVGWDPRDVGETFTEAVVRGVLKAGANARVLGIAPTPLVPLYIMHQQAAGGFMVTASHNPRNQNGIKTFLAFRGMKLLPENDIVLTQTLLRLKTLRNKPLKGKRIDCRADALEFFKKFSMALENSWAENISFENVVLVVDPARGSLTGLAAEIFRRMGFAKVVEVNNQRDGNVNHNSGVADLEGHARITPPMMVKGSGLFARHEALLKLFELGRRHRQRARLGKLRVAGAVFDADGDRFYHLEYHPFKDCLLVLSGDETAYLQGEFLIQRDPKTYRGSGYIHTVESDLRTGLAAEKLGFKRQLSAVGDKWILFRIATMIVASRLRALPQSGKVTALKKKLRALKKSTVFDATQFQQLEQSIDALEQTSAVDFKIPFAVGSEETGHNITLGWLTTARGRRVPVFPGNGMKSALNTLAATQALMAKKSVTRGYAHLARPFPPGFKACYYVYYIRKELFQNNSQVWRRIKRLMTGAAKRSGFRVRTLLFREDPEMLYLALAGASGAEAGIFVRNSGTENKISVNLRGSPKDQKVLKAIGEQAVRLLFAGLKDETDHHYQQELDLLSQIAGRPMKQDAVKDSETQRVLKEMSKQELIRLTGQGYRLTPRGKWYITSDRFKSSVQP